jgi:DNA-binding CsgD family transcriptional regulator
MLANAAASVALPTDSVQMIGACGMQSNMAFYPKDDDKLQRRAALNVRETECLKWVAAGKTSSEIAQITTLSEHTVNHYLAICCRKLDAVNRIQAAVKAVRLGII